MRIAEEILKIYPEIASVSTAISSPGLCMRVYNVHVCSVCANVSSEIVVSVLEHGKF